MKLKIPGIAIIAFFLMMTNPLTVSADEASATKLTSASNTTASGTAINVTNFPELFTRCW